MVEAGNLASVFQLTAGISLAINVFRAPHEQQYQRLGAILDAEETLLKDRTGPAVSAKAAQVAALRTTWVVAGREITETIIGWERLIWLGVALSVVLLLFSSLWGDLQLAFWWATALVGASLAPIIAGVAMMWCVTREKLRPLESALNKV